MENIVLVCNRGVRCRYDSEGIWFVVRKEEVVKQAEIEHAKQCDGKLQRYIQDKEI